MLSTLHLSSKIQRNRGLQVEKSKNRPDNMHTDDDDDDDDYDKLLYYVIVNVSVDIFLFPVIES
jgi:hypothetical protein